jgi:hypothetical protein
MHLRPQQIDECLSCLALCAFFYLMRGIVAFLRSGRDADKFYPPSRPFD